MSEQMAEPGPVVDLDSNALEAAQLLAERRLAALVVIVTVIQYFTRVVRNRYRVIR